MRPEEIQRRGASLAERVRTHVDTRERLEIMLRVQRRRRVAALAVAAAMVLAVVVGVFMLATVEEPPVITVPPTTVPSTVGELRSLPVEVFMVLSAYTVDEATGRCEGSGPLAGIGEGSLVHIHDQSVYDSADDAPMIALPAGEEVTAEDSRSSFLLSRDDSAACVFSLPDLGYDIADYENISLFPEADPDVSTGSAVRGQRVVFTFGDSP